MFTKNFAAIEVTPTQWKLVISSLNLDANQIEILHTATYPTGAGANLRSDIENFNVGHISYCVNNQYGMTFIPNKEINDVTFDFEKRSRSLQNQNADYFNLGKSSILLSIPKDNVEDLLSFSKSVKLPSSINHNDAVLMYTYKRNYSDCFSATSAIVNIQPQHVSVLVFQNNLIKSVLFFNIESDTNIVSEILHNLVLSSQFCDVRKFSHVIEHVMLDNNAKSANQDAASHFTYDLVAFAGETSIDFATKIKSAAPTAKLNIKEVDTVNLLASGLISTLNPRFPQNKRIEFEAYGYNYLICANAICMHVEGLGIDLSLDHPDNTLSKSVPSEIAIRIERDVLSRAATVASHYAQKLTPALTNQKTFVIAALLITLILTGCRYYDYNSSEIKLHNKYSDELAKEKSLTDIKKKYDNLKVRNNLINQRIKAVENIQQTQLLVPTIMIDVQKVASESNFHDLITINQLSINGSELKISGIALDKFKVANFASRLQQSNYEDVTPTKYTSIDAVQCSYEIACRHIGAVAGNPVRDLPPQTQFQRVQQVMEPSTK